MGRTGRGPRHSPHPPPRAAGITHSAADTKPSSWPSFSPSTSRVRASPVDCSPITTHCGGWGVVSRAPTTSPGVRPQRGHQGSLRPHTRPVPAAETQGGPQSLPPPTRVPRAARPRQAQIHLESPPGSPQPASAPGPPPPSSALFFLGTRQPSLHRGSVGQGGTRTFRASASPSPAPSLQVRPSHAQAPLRS